MGAWRAHRAGWRWEPRAEAPTWKTLLITLAAIGLAGLVVTGVFINYGVEPLSAWRTIVERTLWQGRGLSETVRKAIPLMLAGIGLLLAFRARFWNIGAEGQMLAGALGASAVALFAGIPAPFTIPAMFAAGMLAGAAWGAVPALLKARLGVNEIITTLMFNYIALYIVRYLINGPWKARTATGFSYSERFPVEAVLPTLGTTRLHWPTLAIALALVAVIAVLLARSRFGFEVEVLGRSPEAARYAGINAARVTLILAALAAGAAGLAGVGEVAGIHRRLVEPTQLSLGYGYAAILVALLARGRPLMVIPAALFLGFVFAAGDVMRVSLRLPSQLPDVVTGLVLLLVAASEPLTRGRWVPREPAEPPGPSAPPPLGEGA
jgi:general nucleoside transport system permease protein